MVVCQGCSEVEEPPSDFTDPFSTVPRPAYSALQNRWVDQVDVSGDEVFNTDDDYILKDGEPFFIKGIVYVPSYPGYLPWDIEIASSLPEKLRNSIDRDIATATSQSSRLEIYSSCKRCG
jgi:hypothetical protein